MRKSILTLLILAIISLAMGCGIALGVAEVNYLRCGDDTGIFELDEDGPDINQSGTNYTVKWEFSEGTYIDKFVYFYSSTNYHWGEMTIEYANPYGVIEEEIIEDKICSIYSRSVTNIKNTVLSITLFFDDNANDLNIWGGQAKNTRSVNPYLALLFAVVIFIAVFLVYFRKTPLYKTEYIFLICAVSIASLITVVEPTYFAGLDEQIHFENTAELAALYNTEEISVSLADHINNMAIEFRHSICQTIEERADTIRAYNDVGRRATYREPNTKFSKEKVAYIIPAIVLRLCFELKLPGYVSIVLGKLSFVLAFVLLSFVAIRIIPVYKNLLAIVLLLPTVLFISTCYSADSLIIGSFAVAFAILIKGMTDTESKLSYVEQILFVVCMILGCCPKPIYAPLILSGFLIPQRAYKSRRNMILARIIIVLATIGVLSTFVIPFISHPETGRDARGGDTDSVLQLSYVLGYPFAYAWLLISSILKNFASMTVNGSLQLGYCESLGSYGNVIAFSVLSVAAITDRYRKSPKIRDLNVKDKLLLIVPCIIVICLIWTALYISFTPAGIFKINGVQGRYFTPMFMPFLLLLNSRRITNRMNENNYRALIFGGVCAVSLIYVTTLMILPECL